MAAQNLETDNLANLTDAQRSELLTDTSGKGLVQSAKSRILSGTGGAEDTAGFLGKLEGFFHRLGSRNNLYSSENDFAKKALKPNRVKNAVAGVQNALHKVLHKTEEADSSGKRNNPWNTKNPWNNVDVNGRARKEREEGDMEIAGDNLLETAFVDEDNKQIFYTKNTQNKINFCNKKGEAIGSGAAFALKEIVSTEEGRKYFLKWNTMGTKQIKLMCVNKTLVVKSPITKKYSLIGGRTIVKAPENSDWLYFPYAVILPLKMFNYDNSNNKESDFSLLDIFNDDSGFWNTIKHSKYTENESILGLNDYNTDIQIKKKRAIYQNGKYRYSQKVFVNLVAFHEIELHCFLGKDASPVSHSGFTETEYAYYQAVYPQYFEQSLITINEKYDK